MTDAEILNYIEEHGLYRTLKNFDIEHDFFIRNSEQINIDILFTFIESCDYEVNELFIEQLIDNSIIEKDKIYDLPMQVYVKLSDEFIYKYKSNINWNRMFLYYITNDNIDIWKYEDIIKEYDLWHLASTIKLPLEFINKYSENLDWEYILMVNSFDDNDLNKYPNLLPMVNYQ
jgi:hypothetical protein